MIWLWVIAASWAGDILVRPFPPNPAPGECLQSIPITKGKPVPVSLARDGVAVCSAIAEPVSSLAYLLAIERYEKATSELHVVDVGLLKAERDWYKAKYQSKAAPVPWLDRPSTQRWLGRMETLFTVAVVAGAASAAYVYAPERSK